MTNATATWDDFKKRMNEIKDLDGVVGLLGWDEETYAPPGARAQRGNQTATLEAIRHQRLVDPMLGELIDRLLADPTVKASAEENAMVLRMKRRRDLATKIPEPLVKALAEARSRSLDGWQKARATGDFGSWLPNFEEILSLLRERADALGGGGRERYDALLDEYEPGTKTSALRPVLEELRQGLVPLVEAILGHKKPQHAAFLEKKIYDADAQWKLTLRVLSEIGFDLERGRQDRSTHPFTNACSENDVRVTTRIFETEPLSAIYSTIHECGHGLYEQGFPKAWHRTTIAEAPSMGIHESQSRLWENQVGRSRAFWQYFFPIFRDTFPEQTKNVALDEIYAAVNRVAATPIRVEADEVTYNLHILLRFELEVALVAGDLSPRDVPGAWTEKMKKYLGIAPKDDAEGCLQDIHWAWGAVGYFPTYSIGNLYSAQLMAAYERAHPSVWSDIEHGRFSPLRDWLRAHVHTRGYLKSAAETVKDAVGADLEVRPFLDYLAKKYGELYGV
jgi:carboxypeptidase Taq